MYVCKYAYSILNVNFKTLYTKTIKNYDFDYINTQTLYNQTCLYTYMYGNQTRDIFRNRRVSVHCTK
jgi:hypothetical protein